MKQDNKIFDIINNFLNHQFTNEDDLKLHTYSSIIRPILEDVNPNAIQEFKSEHRFIHGGRSDALFRNIAFEYKAYKAFNKTNGIKEALYGRNEKDSGLYHYIINSSYSDENDSIEDFSNKIDKNIGVGFDGNQFIFARFIPSPDNNKLDLSKTKINDSNSVYLPLKFDYKITNLEDGINRLILLLKQQQKVSLTKNHLQLHINPNVPQVREDIKKIYEILLIELDINMSPNNRIRTLYTEWESVFGILYGEEQDETEFNEVKPAVKSLYRIPEHEDIDMKIYLFAMQTYFNIMLKLLINSFIKTILNPNFVSDSFHDNSEIINLFEGRNESQQKFVDNFFEIHYYEWFTYSEHFDMNVINSILSTINKFDLSSFVLKPEFVQDIFQEVYMGLIPADLRHIMGEYFSPDWLVELSLDRINYTGNLDKRIVDPACGSGAFIIQILKRLISNNNSLDYKKIQTITNNVVGFDINPISAVSAKANYIIVLFSKIYDDIENILKAPISIPIYIADSVLAPVVYSEQNKETFTAKTHVGEFEIPKFDSYRDASRFLDILSQSIYKEEAYDLFEIRLAHNNYTFSEKNIEIIKHLYNKIYRLHRASKNSFWAKILKNSFAPIMIDEKFDYVCGNPPWIAWKSMSKTYRIGTGEVWRSYGIFEKNAYDKKTTHDDFGMAVTYVAIDQYLKNNGEMVFILPSSFLKSGKGGHGFRKFHISRNGQDIPFSVESVDSFSNEMVFTINSNIVTFKKNKKMVYPMHNYNVWSFKPDLLPKDRKFDNHDHWYDVKKKLDFLPLKAQPISGKDIQSQWLTLEEISDFQNKVLDKDSKRVYAGRKGIEPAGAKGVYILKDLTVKNKNQNYNTVNVTTDFSRQRRQDFLDKGPITRDIEDTFIYPMLGGRNFERWKVRNNTFMVVPHTKNHKYGIPEKTLLNIAPNTFDFLTFYKEELLASRIQNGKFFNEKLHPFYRLDNIGEYTYSTYKVIWKEQVNSMSAVVISNYEESIPNFDESLFNENKMVVVDSKVLYLSLENKEEAYYVCGIINSPNIREIIDGYAINTNRGTDVLSNIYIPKFNNNNSTQVKISRISIELHDIHRLPDWKNYTETINDLELQLSNEIIKLYK